MKSLYKNIIYTIEYLQTKPKQMGNQKYLGLLSIEFVYSNSLLSKANKLRCYWFSRGSKFGAIVKRIAIFLFYFCRLFVKNSRLYRSQIARCNLYFSYLQIIMKILETGYTFLAKTIIFMKYESFTKYKDKSLK